MDDKWLIQRSEAKRLLMSLKKENFSNIQILNEFKIIHAFETKEYPVAPTDYETEYLIYGHLISNAT